MTVCLRGSADMLHSKRALACDGDLFAGVRMDERDGLGMQHQPCTRRAIQVVAHDGSVEPMRV